MKAVNLLTGEVVEVSFYTPYMVPLRDAEKMSDETMTVQAHLSTKDQVESFMMAGKRLNEARGFYDSDLLGDEVEEAEAGIGQGADLVDVQRSSVAVESEVSRKEAEQRTAEAAKKKADDEAAFEAEVNRRLAMKEKERSGEG